jgi:hypothetical protein
VNLVLLVEGRQTEPRVYRAWLRQRRPALVDVPNVADLTTDRSLHLDYLREMLAEHSHRYSKISPGVVLQPSYFDALRARRERRGHLPSFGKLLDALRAIGGLEP